LDPSPRPFWQENNKELTSSCYIWVGGIGFAAELWDLLIAQVSQGHELLRCEVVWAVGGVDGTFCEDFGPVGDFFVIDKRF